MTVHVMRLAGPTQVWPNRARYDTRPTLPEPTYSAVCGFLHACLGQPRPEPGQPWELHPALAGAHIAVRVDHRGEILNDYQTINPLPLRMFRGDPKYAGTKHNQPDPSDRAIVRDGKGGVWMGGHNAYTSTRQYLADASFTLLITTRDDTAQTTLTDALTHPRFTPYLGRKNSPPTWPWYLGDLNAAIEDAARTVPALTRDRNLLRALRALEVEECPLDDEPLKATFDLHHLQGGPTTGVSTTSTPTEPVDRPGGRYRTRTLIVTHTTAPVVSDTKTILTWAAGHLSQPARTADA